MDSQEVKTAASCDICEGTGGTPDSFCPKCEGHGFLKPKNIPMITHWPSDRISDDRSVEDRIHNAVMAERERCAKVAAGRCEGRCGDLECEIGKSIAEAIRSEV